MKLLSPFMERIQCHDYFGNAPSSTLFMSSGFILLSIAREKNHQIHSNLFIDNRVQQNQIYRKTLFFGDIKAKDILCNIIVKRA